MHTCKNNSAFTVTVVIRMILEKKYEYMIEKVIKKIMNYLFSNIVKLYTALKILSGTGKICLG